MRILILSDDFPPQSFGGAGFSTFALAHGLQKAGHDVFVITCCQKKSEEGSFDYQGLKVFRIFANYHDRWRAYLSLYNPQTVSRVEKLIKEMNPDIVHANNIHRYISYHCLKIAKDSGKTVFFTARDTMAFSYDKLATKNYLDKLNARISWLDNFRQAKKRYNPLRNFLIKRYLKNVDKIFSVSNALKNALNQNGIKNVETIYTGIDSADWKVNSAAINKFKKKHNLSGKKIVFFGGRISSLKGLDQINRAMAIVQKEVPKAVLLVAGNEGIGWLKGDELKAAYWSANVAVVPSVYLDPFPRSNLEAMACKRPIVATCYGGSPEIVKDGYTGYIVNPFNTELLAKRIIDLLKNTKKAKKFGQAGCNRVKKDYSLDSYIERTLSFYHSLKPEFKIDFIGLGVPRAGTTWIHKCLEDHPQICLPRQKSLEKLDFSRYRSSFSHCQSGQRRGHIESGWLYFKEAPELIKENFPQVKLIVCLRNPIKRLHSHSLLKKSKGETFEWSRHKEMGLYFEYLKRYFEVFPRKQILTLIYEDIQKNPLKFIRSIYKFLGADSNFIPRSLSQKINPTSKNDRLILQFLNSYNISRFSSYLKASIFGRKALALLKFFGFSGFVNFILSKNIKEDLASGLEPSKQKLEIDSKLRIHLQKFYKKDIAKLAKLIKRDLSHWK